MNYADVLNNARQCIGQYCKACPVCNGVACKNQMAIRPSAIIISGRRSG